MPAPPASIRSSSSRTATSRTASWRRRSNTARAPCRWRPTSTRSWRWCGTLAERLGIYLLNSINPFRIEGQKTIMVEMMDQRDWRVPDWIVLPGGNLGNTSAFGKALREMQALGLIGRLPRLAVIQAEGSAPFYDLLRATPLSPQRRDHPETLATAIKIGDPVSWPKALHEVLLRRRGGESDRAGNRRRQGVIGRCGIGCEPASAATLAGIRKLTAAGVMRPRRRGGGADRQPVEGPRLHSPLSHRRPAGRLLAAARQANSLRPS
jgi:hypothetical protein